MFHGAHSGATDFSTSPEDAVLKLLYALFECPTHSPSLQQDPPSWWKLGATPIRCSPWAALQGLPLCRELRRPRLSPLLTAVGASFPLSSTEARKEFQSHDGIVSAWSSLSSQGAETQNISSIWTGHRDKERLSLSTGSKRAPSVFNLFCQKS